jgi:predicted metallo-beta-lactamase superfamily hydrolase
MTNMNAIELMKAVDHASGMDDRWLFVASLAVIGSFGMWVMRYFVKQHERLIADHKHSRECYQSSLRRVVGEQSAANAKLVVCLDNNSKILEQCRDELRRSRRRKNTK